MSKKIKLVGSFLVLALVMSLVSVVPLFSATTGTVTLDADIYSDKDTFNVATFTVADADLSPVRTGIARFGGVTGLNGATGVTTPFDLTGGGADKAILEGEKAYSQTFSGNGATAAFPFTAGVRGRDANGNGVLADNDVVVKLSGVVQADTAYDIDLDAGGTYITGVTFGTPPPTGTNNVVIECEVSEYDQGETVNTPIGLPGSSVMFGPSFAAATNSKTIDSINNATGEISTTSDILPGQYVIITFMYNVKENIADVATITSTTATALGKSRAVDGAETTASSNQFVGKVALYTAANLTLIENEAADIANDTTNVNGKVEINELNNTLGLGPALFNQVQNDAGDLGLNPATDLASAFIALVVPVSDGDTLTVTYLDASPVGSAQDTATIDLVAPTITLVSPADKSYTSDQILQMQATVVDTGSGINQGDVTLVPTGTGAGSTSTLPIADGFRVSFVPSSNMTEGAKSWYVGVKDKVGNAPATGADAPRGSQGNPFQFTVDITGPVVTAAETGGKVDTAGDVVADNTARKAVTVTLDLGTGTAPVDPATVSPSDFQVGGVTPASAVVDKDGDKILLLMSADQSTSAKPKVQLVGSISDKAGNARTEGTIAAATDKLAPVISVTVSGEAASVPVSSDLITIDVLSSEAAQTPLITVAFLEQAGDGTLQENDDQKKPVAAASIGVNAWRATVDIDATTGTAGAGTNGAMNVQVSVVDFAGNTATKGVADPDGTGPAGVIVEGAVMFEFDSKLAGGTAPTGTNGGFALSPNIGTADAPKTDIDSPFVTINFDAEATEYLVGAALIDVDTHGAATLLSAVLRNPSGVDTDVMSRISQIDENSFSLATSGLALGEYKLTVTAKDAVGNFSTDPTDTEPEEYTFTFTVVEKAPFQLGLKPGMNLVSIPMDPASTAINSVIPATAGVDLVVTYDPANPAGPWLIAQRNATTGLFEGTLATIDASHGYWMRANSFVTLKIDLPRQAAQALLPTVNVVKGWNLVPVIDLAQQAQGTAKVAATYFLNVGWNVAWTFNTQQNAWVGVPANTNVVLIGNAYWLWATAAGTITP